MMRRFLLLCWASSCLGWYAAASGQEVAVPDAQDVFQAVWSISGAECYEHVAKLAGEEMAGRATGSAEFLAAARYIAEQFRSMGLQSPEGFESFLQRFSLDRNIIEPGSEFALEVPIKGKKGYDTLWVPYQLESDFLPFGPSRSGEVIAETVFIGYGISSPENKWDDYRGKDLRNKTVVVLTGTPNLENASWGDLGRLRYKYGFAEKAGAAAFIGIGGPYATIHSDVSLPSVLISEKVANDLLKGTGYTLQKMIQEINTQKTGMMVPTRFRTRLKVQNRLEKNCETANIVAVLRGSDPVLKDEYLVLGAHADHLGVLDRFVFYGANDNGSGTAVLLEVAQAFSLLKTPLRRSIIFIAFTGEEMGLLGAKHFVDHPIVDLKNVKAMINMDMVGSGRKGIMVVCGKVFPEFAALFEKTNQQPMQIPILTGGMSRNSDHYPFYEKGIPSVFLFTMGGVSTWHSTRDRAETLDSEVMEMAGRQVFRVLYELANQEHIHFPEREAN